MMMKMPLMVAAAIAVLAGCSLLPQAQGFSTEVPSGESHCFLLAVEKDDVIDGNFEQLTEASPEPIYVTLHQVLDDGEAEATRVFEGQEEGVFKVYAKDDGLYRLCLGNGNKDVSDGLPRTYGFAFRLGAFDDDNIEIHLNEENTSERQEQVGDLLDSAEMLMGDLKTLMDHQAYMRQREEIHRSTTESTNSRILWWTLTEAVVLVSISVWQATYIRQFFEVKRIL